MKGAPSLRQLDGYFTDVDGLIQIVQDAYSSGDFEAAKNQLDFENNRDCPLN